MNDDIRALTAEVAADPSSLAFLDLAEALRRRDQIEAAEKVVINGLTRYPHLPAAHDLYARILADRQDFQRAFDEWDMTLRLDSRHLGALKGLGFLYYHAADHAQALVHLEAAWREAPGDEGLHHAITRLRELVNEEQAPPLAESVPGADPFEAAMSAVTPASAPAGPPTPFGGAAASGQRLLIGSGGLAMAGTMETWTGENVTERAASESEGVAHEALRTADRVGLGKWKSLVIESDGMHACLVAPTAKTILLEVQEREVPIGQITLMADRAARGARLWLGEVG
jgi:tetratricopeptide (TPR) repeat protein